MRNFIQPGVNLTLPAPAAIVSGEVIVIGELHGVAAGDAESGADFDLVTEGVYALDKVSTDVFAIGDYVFYDAAEKLVTSDDDTGANALIGIAVTVAANPSGTVNVKLI
jgi:predicted RecA/RadA family phage recombinase